MEYYCGTDIIEVERVKKAISQTEGFKQKVFTEKEIAYAEGKGENVKYQHYAGRFAAKEAIYKAVSNIDNTITFGNIEIINNKENKERPIVTIYNQDGSVRDDIKNIDVSISHIKELAIATAVISIDNKPLV